MSCEYFILEMFAVFLSVIAKTNQLIKNALTQTSDDNSPDNTSETSSASRAFSDSKIALEDNAVNRMKYLLFINS